MSRTYGPAGVKRKKKATLVTPKECLLDAVLKGQIDLPQVFLKRNYAADYAADFQHDLLVKFVLLGQQCGPEVHLPVSKGRNRQNEQTGKISWKHKLCISGQVRQALPRLCWVRTVEATGPRRLTVKLQTQQQHVQQVHQQKQRRQLPGAGQGRVPSQQKQKQVQRSLPQHTQQASLQARPQPTSSTMSACPARRQAAAKLRSAATSRARSSKQQATSQSAHAQVEPAAKRLRTTAGRVETAAAAGAGARLPGAVAPQPSSALPTSPTAAAAAKLAAGVALVGASRSDWQSVNQMVSSSTCSLGVAASIAALLQTQQKQQQQTRVQVQLLFSKQQSDPGNVAAVAVRDAVGASTATPTAAPRQQQQSHTSPWMPCLLVSRVHKGAAGMSYHVTGDQLQQQLKQHAGWCIAAARLSAGGKLQYRLQQQPAMQQQQQQQHTTPVRTVQHEQQRQGQAAGVSLPSRKRILYKGLGESSDDEPARKLRPKQQRRLADVHPNERSSDSDSSLQKPGCSRRPVQAQVADGISPQRRTAGQQQQRKQQQHQQQQQQHQQQQQLVTAEDLRKSVQQQRQQTSLQQLGKNIRKEARALRPSPAPQRRRRSQYQHHQLEPKLQEPLEPAEHSLPDEAAPPAAAAASVGQSSIPSHSDGSSSSDNDSSSDEDFVVSDDHNIPTDNYNGYGEVTESLNDLKVLSPGFWGPLRQKQHGASEQQHELDHPPLLEQSQQQQGSLEQQWLSEQHDSMQLTQQHHSQQEQPPPQQRQMATGHPGGADQADCTGAPAAGPVAASGASQQPSAAEGAGGSSNNSTGDAAVPGKPADNGAAADGGGYGGSGGDGDDGGAGDDKQGPTAPGTVGGLDSSTVVSYFLAVSHQAKWSAPRVTVRVPKLLVDHCLPELAKLEAGGSCHVDVQLLLLPETTEAHALIIAGEEGVLSLCDTQRGTVRAKTKRVGRGDSRKTQLMYSLEDIACNYQGELWALGVSTYAGCSGLRIMLSSRNPGRAGPRSKDYIMAVTADGRVVYAVTGVVVKPAMVVPSKQGPAAAEPDGRAALSAASLDARGAAASAAPPVDQAAAAEARGAADAAGSRGAAAAEKADIVPFIHMRQHLETTHGFLVPRKFVKRFLPEFLSLERGDSQQVDVTLALLPPGVTAATPDSQTVEITKLKARVTRLANNRFVVSGPDYRSCELVRCKYYVIGLHKLGETALQLFVSGARLPVKHAEPDSLAASMDLDSAAASMDLDSAAAAAAGDQDADAAELAPSVDDDDDDDESADPLVDPAEAAAEAAEQEAEQVVKAVPAAAGETAGYSAELFEVTQTLITPGRARQTPRLPNTFLLGHFPNAKAVNSKDTADDDSPAGWRPDLQLVLLPPGTLDVSPQSEPLDVLNVSGCQAATWRHPTREAMDKTDLRGLMKILSEWAARDELSKLYLVGLRALGPNRLQLLFSRELHPDAKPFEFVKSAEDRLQSRRAAAATAAAAGAAVRSPVEQRKPMAGRRLSKTGSGTGRPGQLQKQVSDVSSALGRSGSGLSGFEWRPLQQLAAAGVIAAPAERHKRPMSGQPLLPQGSGSLLAEGSGNYSLDIKRSRQEGAGTAAAPSPRAVADSGTSSHQQQQQQRPSRLGPGSLGDMASPRPPGRQQHVRKQAHPGHVIEASGALMQELADLDIDQGAAAAAAAKDVDMQDASDQQQQQQQHCGSEASQHGASEAEAAAAAAALLKPTAISSIRIRYYPAAKYQGIKIDMHSLWAAAFPDHLMDADTHQLVVQFVQDAVVVTGPVVCNIKAFPPTSAYPDHYVRLHQCISAPQQPSIVTLDALIQQYDNYRIIAIAAVAAPRRSDGSSSSGGAGSLDLLNLHIAPPAAAAAGAATPAVAAEGSVSQQPLVAPAGPPQQQQHDVEFAAAQPATDAALEHNHPASAPQQQQRRSLQHSDVSQGVSVSQLQPGGLLQQQQQYSHTSHASQQQQQQHTQPSHPSHPSHQHSGTAGPQQQQQQQVPSTLQTTAAVHHQECESKPPPVPVKQEADELYAFAHQPSQQAPAQLPQHLQQQSTAQLAEPPSPFIEAPAGAVDGAAMPQQQQLSLPVQPHTGPVNAANAPAAAAASPVNSLGGGTSTAGGSASQAQPQVSQQLQDPELQVPLDATGFTEAVFDALVTSSNRLAELEVVTYDEAATFQEMIVMWLPQDGVVPPVAAAFMQRHYKLFAKNLTKNLKMAAFHLRTAVKAYQAAQG